MLKLGTIVKDEITETKGMLTLYRIDMSGNEHYMFQPAGLNKKTHKPLDTIYIDEARIDNGEIDKSQLSKLPTEILGTEVEDIATGFKGKAISLMLYLNGCIHFEVKSLSKDSETGEGVEPLNLDIRRLKGKAIKVLNDKELEESRVNKPSPESHKEFNPFNNQY